MLRQIVGPVGLLSRWLGGWSRLLLFVLVLAALGYGLFRERARHPPTPPQAQDVRTQLMPNTRQTSFRFNGSPDELRAFYQQTLPQEGWRYCGTQATPGCTNMRPLAEGADQVTDVYRRADDTANEGATVEIWPMRSEGGSTYVTMFEVGRR